MSRGKFTVKALAWTASLVAGLQSDPTQALTLTTRSIDETGTVVIATGTIAQGDRAKLVSLLDSLPLGAPAKGLLLDSPGGSVLEAERLAATIRTSRLVIGVTQGSMCASACFLLFAAGPSRFAQVGARIGVHSASVDAGETMGTMAVTTAMARDASAYGVPSAIIGRMVTTEPGRMAWLSGDELRSMGTTIIPVEIVQPSSRPAPPTASPFAPGQTTTAMVQPGSPMPSLAFQQGLEDRKGWEAWFNALPAIAHAGALYWTGQRSLKQPGLCTAAPSDVADVFAWGVGCVEAQKRLRASDMRRKADPDYRAGWNSL